MEPSDHAPHNPSDHGRLGRVMGNDTAIVLLLSDLQRTVEALRADNSALAERAETLRNENEALGEQAAALREQLAVTTAQATLDDNHVSAQSR